MSPIAGPGGLPAPREATSRLARRAPRRLPRFRWAAAVAAVLVLAGFALTPTGRYLVRGAWQEALILGRRRPIVELIADPATEDAVRHRLQLVLHARDFAADSIGLETGQSFTTYSPIGRDTLLLVLSAAHRDRLEAYTWWFPVVGRVPYKGFFDFRRARSSAFALDRDGLDVYLRPASAFSTLGWFDDPLLSTTLFADTLSLANTVIHELTHNSFYAPGQAVFNESFANFVGSRGAAWLFRVRGEEQAAQQVEARWSDDKILARFWREVAASLDSAYALHPEDRQARLAARETVYRSARGRLVHEVGPQLRTTGREYLERLPLNNAALLARRIYLTELDVFDAVWQREGRDLRAAVERVIAIAAASPREPYAALRAWLDSAGTEPAA